MFLAVSVIKLDERDQTPRHLMLAVFKSTTHVYHKLNPVYIMNNQAYLGQTHSTASCYLYFYII